MTDLDHTADLTAACTAARLAFGAASVSIAVVTAGGADLPVDHLHYVAAEGRGSDGIVGVRLPAGKGIASYVAATGQALVVDSVADDARFARDVAERVGYLPGTLLAVPITDRNGQVLGVLSVLDRGNSAGDALALGSAFAAAVAPLVASFTADRATTPTGLPSHLAALDPEQREAVLDLLDGIVAAVQPRRRGRRD